MKARPAFLSALFVAILFGGLAKAQDGPKDMGEAVMISKAEVARINALFKEAADIITAQKKEIDKLKNSSGCT